MLLFCPVNVRCFTLSWTSIWVHSRIFINVWLTINPESIWRILCTSVLLNLTWLSGKGIKKYIANDRVCYQILFVFLVLCLEPSLYIKIRYWLYVHYNLVFHKHLRRCSNLHCREYSDLSYVISSSYQYQNVKTLAGWFSEKMSWGHFRNPWDPPVHCMPNL